MTAIDVSLSTLFTHLPMCDRFAAAADLGFRHVEFRWPFGEPVAEMREIEAVARAVTAAGVEVVAVSAWPGPPGSCGVLHRCARDAAACAHLDSVAELTDAVGCTLVASLGGAGSSQSIAAGLRPAAERFAARGLRLVIEPVNALEFPGTGLNTWRSAVKVVRSLRDGGIDNVYVLADVYHELTERRRIGGDIVAELHAALPYVGHAQLAGIPNRRRPEPDALPWPALLDAFDEFYSGFIGCEYLPEGRTTVRQDFSWLHATPLAEQISVPAQGNAP